VTDRNSNGTRHFSNLARVIERCRLNIATVTVPANFKIDQFAELRYKTRLVNEELGNCSVLVRCISMV
jgi:hypothetical protein